MKKAGKVVRLKKIARKSDKIEKMVEKIIGNGRIAENVFYFEKIVMKKQLKGQKRVKNMLKIERKVIRFKKWQRNHWKRKMIKKLSVFWKATGKCFKIEKMVGETIRNGKIAESL